MINIKDFLIINITQFESLINFLGTGLNKYDSIYTLTYLFTNFLAYIMIIVFCYIVKVLYFSFFKHKKRYF